MSDGQNCAVPLIEHWSHTVNFYSYVLLVIWTWLWLMQVCTVTSEGWMVAWWQCSVPCRWTGMAWLQVGNLPSLVLEGALCRLVQGCVSGINWKAAPVMMYVPQAENLALSCCLNLFPNSKWFCKTLNLTNFPGCVPLQNFGWASSPSQWSWADCLRMRHLAGSPPEQEGWMLAKFPMSSLGKSVGCSGSLLQFWPILKKDSEK